MKDKRKNAKGKMQKVKYFIVFVIYCIIKAKCIAEDEMCDATEAQSGLLARNQGIFSFMKKMPCKFVSFWQVKMTQILLYRFGTILA